MIVCQRSVGNGIKKSTVSKVNVPPRQTQAVQDRTRHVVSFTYGRNHSVIVEYKPDDSKDMFQVCYAIFELILSADWTIIGRSN